MSSLKTHDLNDIVAILPGGTEVPGDLVRHVDDSRSRGIVITCEPEKKRPANSWSTQDLDKRKCTVLWSIEPVKPVPKQQPLPASPVKQLTKSPKQQSWELFKREYQGEFRQDPVAEKDALFSRELLDGSMTMKDVMDADRDIIDIVMHHDIRGNEPSFEFKRRSSERRWREPVLYDGSRTTIKRYDDDW